MKKWKRFLSVLLAVAIVVTGVFVTEISQGGVKASAMNPSNLGLGDTWTPGEIATSKGVNFYSVRIPSAGWLTFDYQGWSIGDSHYEVLNEDMTKKYVSGNIFDSSNINPKTKTHVLALEAGTYIIKINGYYTDNVGEYHLKVSFKAANNNEQTNNNEFAAAQELSKNKAVRGFLSIDDRVDFFRINLTKKECVRLILTSYVDDDTHIDIYNQDNIKIKSGNIWSTNENNPKTYEFEEVLNPGIYYIKISPYGNSDHGVYTIEYKEKILAKSIKIKPSKSSVVAGKTLKLTANVSPSNTSDKTIRWMSGDTSIARIDENTGKVTTYRAGVVKFTATAQDGSGVSKTYTLVVKPKKMSAPYLSSPRVGQMYVSYSQSGVSGYQIQYATNKKFTGSVQKRTTKSYLTIKRLKKNTKYYVRVRAYVKRGKTYHYGAWSARKTIRTRK